MGQRRGGEFFATLKKELVHQCDYVDQAEARASIFEYIEIFYNRIRLHSALGGMSPEQFKQQKGKRKREETQKGTFYFFGFLGRPRGRSEDSSPSWTAVDGCHVESPKGVPRERL